LPNLEIMDAAVWTEDATMKLFGLVEDDCGSTSTGASLISEHNFSTYESDSESAIEVPTLDFPKLLRSKFDYDEIVIKMDVEASEYDVLEKMIAAGDLNHVEYMFIEFYSHFMKGDDRKRTEDRERKIVTHMDALHKLYIWH
jgi:FkbM family methyltransferase